MRPLLRLIAFVFFLVGLVVWSAQSCKGPPREALVIGGVVAGGAVARAVWSPR